MKVIRMAEYQQRETVQTLEKLLAQARRGEVDGLMFAVKVGGDHCLGSTGAYARNMAMAMAVSLRFMHLLNRQADKGLSPENVNYTAVSCTHPAGLKQKPCQYMA